MTLLLSQPQLNRQSVVEACSALCHARQRNGWADHPIKKEQAMADVIIRVSKNGPYEVEGGAKLFDHQGKEYQEDQFPPLYLCRCGQSKNKPFCDGSHEDAGFKAEETAG
jgi:CDGSH iron-sulfur domain-containing protein 3